MATDTKARILDAAERLFADNGYSATSLRDITNEAGVNLAAVNYHFGSKEALLSAVLERRVGPVNQKRLELLDAAEALAGTQPLALETVLRAFLAPPFQKRQEWGEAGAKFMQVVGRLHSETNEQFRASFLHHFDQVVQRFLPAFQRTLPHLPPDEVSWRILFLIGAMAHTMTWSEMIGFLGGRQLRNPEEIMEALLQFAAGGLAAPAPANTPIPARKTGGGA